MKDKNKDKIKETVKNLLILSVLTFAFLPLLVMIIISFKDNTQFVNSPFIPSLPMHFENWSKAFYVVLPYIGNSIFVSISSCAICLTAALCTAYVFARFEFMFKEVLWYLMISLIFMPGIMNLIPLFVIMKDLNFLNSLLGLILLYATMGQVLCVFVLRSFIEEIPEELFEAAEIDGASFPQQIINVVLPMTGSILGTLGIMNFIGSWNAFIEPLVFLNDRNKQLLPVVLMDLNGEYVKQWGQLMACYSLAAIPLVIIFIFSMKLFVKGLSAGAVKG